MLIQPNLFDQPEPEAPRFDGATFDPELDTVRLGTLQRKVMELMKDGEWRTLAAIRGWCGGSEASISARLRDARKPRFGGHTVNHRRTDNPGVWEYQIVTRVQAEG